MNTLISIYLKMVSSKSFSIRLSRINRNVSGWFVCSTNQTGTLSDRLFTPVLTRNSTSFNISLNLPKQFLIHLLAFYFLADPQLSRLTCSPSLIILIMMKRCDSSHIKHKPAVSQTPWRHKTVSTVVFKPFSRSAVNTASLVIRSWSTHSSLSAAASPAAMESRWHMSPRIRSGPLSCYRVLTHRSLLSPTAAGHECHTCARFEFEARTTCRS